MAASTDPPPVYDDDDDDDEGFICQNTDFPVDNVFNLQDKDMCIRK